MLQILFRCGTTGLLLFALCLFGCPADPVGDDDDTTVPDDDDTVGDDDDTTVGDDDDSSVGDDDDSSVGDDDDTVGDDDDSSVGDDDDTVGDDDDTVGDDDDSAVGDDDDSAVGDDDDSALGDDDDSAIGDDDDSAAGPACGDGVDNDSDGWTDLDDPGCVDAADDDEASVSTLECSDGIDNDADGDVDAADTACADGHDDLEAALRVGDVTWSDGGGDSVWSHPETLTITATLYNESAVAFNNSAAQISADPNNFLFIANELLNLSPPAGGSVSLSFTAHVWFTPLTVGDAVTFTIAPRTSSCASSTPACPDTSPETLSIVVN
jgi:hypothetical protein